MHRSNNRLFQGSIIIKLPDEVINHIKNGAKVLNKLAKNIKNNPLNLEIDCSYLPDVLWEAKKLIPEELTSMLETLPDKNVPSLYYFKIISNNTREEILNSYRDMIATKSRACVSLKENPPLATDVLYVGKVKNQIKGRMLQHLGYFHNKDTSGLQLKWWGHAIGLKLNLHIYPFEEEVSPFINSFELPFSQALRPLIGTQK